MARVCDKYKQLVEPNLDIIERMAGSGATKREIAEKLGVGISSLYRWIDEHESLRDAFTRGCRLADDKVEAALFRRACGYEYEETVTEERETKDGVFITTKTFRKVLPPDPTSVIFWLTNRRDGDWQHRRALEAKIESRDGLGVVVLPEVLKDGGDAGA